MAIYCQRCGGRCFVGIVERGTLHCVMCGHRYGGTRQPPEGRDHD